MSPRLLFQVAKDQRKAVMVGFGLAILGLFVGQYGTWTLAFCIAGGVMLAFFNHLATEAWLLKVISGGAEPTRRALGTSTMVRLTIVTIVAVGIAVAVHANGGGWSGIGLLLGLAIFRLIALVMIALPLLKELKNA